MCETCRYEMRKERNKQYQSSKRAVKRQQESARRAGRVIPVTLNPNAVTAAKAALHDVAHACTRVDELRADGLTDDRILNYVLTRVHDAHSRLSAALDL